MGIRLDAGTAFSGAVVTPYYDSLLVKVTAWAGGSRTPHRRMERCLQEFRIRGVKTNIPFLIKLMLHPTFQAGGARRGSSTRRPSCSSFPNARDRATKLLTYLAKRSSTAIRWSRGARANAPTRARAARRSQGATRRRACGRS
jgi:pyruvate carboxylase